MGDGNARVDDARDREHHDGTCVDHRDCRACAPRGQSGRLLHFQRVRRVDGVARFAAQPRQEHAVPRPRGARSRPLHAASGPGGPRAERPGRSGPVLTSSYDFLAFAAAAALFTLFETMRPDSASTCTTKTFGDVSLLRSNDQTWRPLSAISFEL